jgi:hypothetical protein
MPILDVLPVGAVFHVPPLVVGVDEHVASPVAMSVTSQSSSRVGGFSGQSKMVTTGLRHGFRRTRTSPAFSSTGVTGATGRWVGAWVQRSAKWMTPGQVARWRPRPSTLTQDHSLQRDTPGDPLRHPFSELAEWHGRSLPLLPLPSTQDQVLSARLNRTARWPRPGSMTRTCVSCCRGCARSAARLPTCAAPTGCSLCKAGSPTRSGRRWTGRHRSGCRCRAAAPAGSHGCFLLPRIES